MGKLYENIINRDATNRDVNDKILSAYDKMNESLMREANTAGYDVAMSLFNKQKDKIVQLENELSTLVKQGKNNKFINQPPMKSTIAIFDQWAKTLREMIKSKNLKKSVLNR